MKKSKLISLTGLTIAGLHLLNKFTNSKAERFYPDSQYHHFQYQWKYGDIYYTKQGIGSPLLFIHDLTPGSSSFEWQYLISELEKEHTVYALDLIGCGRSSKPDFTYSNFVFVQLINDFITNIIKSDCNIVTSGSSSAIGLMTALFDGTLINKIIMINPPSITDNYGEITQKNKYQNLLFKLPIIGTFLSNKLNTRETFEDLFYKSYFCDSYAVNSSYIDAYYGAYHYNHTSKSLFASIYNHYTYADVSIALNQIENPIFITGGEDEENIHNIIQEYTTKNPSISSKLISPAKHLPQLECPDKLISILRAFLK